MEPTPNVQAFRIFAVWWDLALAAESSCVEICKLHSRTVIASRQLLAPIPTPSPLPTASLRRGHLIGGPENECR
jgi:hypothetical protein